MTPSERLGDRAVRLGLATREQIERALSQQRDLAGRDGDRPRLGALLVQMGAIAPAQLAQLLDQSALGGFHLSEDAVRLAATLQPALGADTRMIMIAGARRRDGASIIAAQTALALALMEHGSILLVDCDFRNPTQHERFGVDASPGLADALRGGVALEDAIRETGVAHLSLLTAGGAGGGAVAQLLSERSTQLLDSLRQGRALTIVDVAPLLEAPESAILGARMDAAVVALAGGRRGEWELREAERMLTALKVRTLGVVLSRRS